MKKNIKFDKNLPIIIDNPFDDRFISSDKRIKKFDDIDINDEFYYIADNAFTPYNESVILKLVKINILDLSNGDCKSCPLCKISCRYMDCNVKLIEDIGTFDNNVYDYNFRNKTVEEIEEYFNNIDFIR